MIGLALHYITSRLYRLRPTWFRACDRQWKSPVFATLRGGYSTCLL